MASLVERNNRYYVVYSSVTENGEKKQKWEGFTTKVDALGANLKLSTGSRSGV